MCLGTRNSFVNDIGLCLVPFGIKIPITWYSYLLQACRFTCYQRKVIEKCTCGDPWYPLQAKAFPVLNGEIAKPCLSQNESESQLIYNGLWEVADFTPVWRIARIASYIRLVFCFLLAVSLDCAQPIIGHVTKNNICLLLSVSSDYAWASHRPGYWSNLSCDWRGTAWAYSEQETENRPRSKIRQDNE